ANHDDFFDSDYPDSFGIKKDNIKMKFNDKSKEGEIEHSSGTKITLKPDGTLEIAFAKDMLFILEGKTEINSKGDIVFTTDGKFSVTSKGDAELKSSDGKVLIEGKSGIDIESDANIKVISQAIAEFFGTASTKVGSPASATMVNGTSVIIANGGKPVAVVGSTCIGIGNLAIPVISNVLDGSAKVFVP
ncbi:MAG: hypothetical protein KAJ19_24310, partial [Gammaproteobacteria bacterium]|nr:hypothetical protein [Gammaproteobacteria bacterium]